MSQSGASLTIAHLYPVEMEVLQASAEHAVSVHLHVDGPELRTQLLSMMKPE